MARHRAATAANDRGPGIAGQHRIIGHQRGGAVIMDMAVMVFRDPGIAFGNHRLVRAGSGKAQDGAQQIGRTNPAIGPESDGFVGDFSNQPDHFSAGQAHHRAASGIKAHRAAPGHIGQREGFGGGAELFGGTDGFDPQHIRATGFQPLGLFMEHLHRPVMGQGAHRCHDFAGRPDRACHHHDPARLVSDIAADFGGDPVDLAHAAVKAMQFQAGCIAAESVGQKQITPCRNRALIQGSDPVRVVHIPHFRRVARHQAHIEQGGAGGSIGQNPVAGRKQAGKSVGHRAEGPFT